MGRGNGDGERISGRLAKSGPSKVTEGLMKGTEVRMVGGGGDYVTDVRRFYSKDFGSRLVWS